MRLELCLYLEANTQSMYSRLLRDAVFLAIILTLRSLPILL